VLLGTGSLLNAEEPTFFVISRAMSIGRCGIKPLPLRTFGGSFGIIRDKHPIVKRCSEILPRHIRDYIPHAITRARAVQRGPRAGEEVRPTAHSWLVDLRVFVSELCA
jgi:hypothetical protein